MYKRIQSIRVIYFFLFLLADDTHSLQLAIKICMRPKFMFLSMVIPSTNSPGWNMDICL